MLRKMTIFAAKFDNYRKMRINHIVLYLAFSMVALCSCGEYNRLLKSNDPDEKYDYAKIYYEQGKYAKAATLLSDVVPIYRGTEEAENALWLLAMSYFNQKDYLSVVLTYLCVALQIMHIQAQQQYMRGHHAFYSLSLVLSQTNPFQSHDVFGPY